MTNLGIIDVPSYSKLLPFTLRFATHGSYGFSLKPIPMNVVTKVSYHIMADFIHPDNALFNS